MVDDRTDYHLNTNLTTKPFDKDIPNLINPSTLQQIELNLNEEPELVNKVSTLSYIYENYIAPNGIIIFILCLLIFFLFVRYYFFADAFKGKDIIVDEEDEEDEEQKLRNQFMKNKLYKQYIQHYRNDSFQDESTIELVGTDDESDFDNDSQHQNNSKYDGINLDHGRDTNTMLENEDLFRYNMNSFIVDQGSKERDKIAKEMFR